MRQVTMLAQMIFVCLFLFCGCSAETEDLQQIILTELSSIDSFELAMDITADYGTRVYKYSVLYTGNETAGNLEITAPEDLAGLKAVLESGKTHLIYDGTIFETGALLPEDGSPIDALPLIIKAWKTGYVTDMSPDIRGGQESLVFTYTLSDTLSLRTWFDTVTHLPVYCEVARDGFTVLYCEISACIPSPK